MKYISAFTGLGSDAIAFGKLGWDAVCLSELESFQSTVLKTHFPRIQNHGDVTQFDWGKYRNNVDILVGGPPCPAFSTAGRRESLADPRGDLLLNYADIADAVRPVWTITENVTGLLSTKDNAFGQFLGRLVGADGPLAPPREPGWWPSAGMAAGPRRAACWRVLDAKHFGLPQQRKRVFVVAHSGDWRRAAQVLFEPYGDGGDSPNRRAGWITPPPRPSGKPRKSSIRVYEDEPIVDGYYAYDRLNNTVSTVIPAVSKSIGLTTGRGILLESRGGELSLRRLIPEEVERLQGFPTGWTDVEWLGKRASDKVRYEALANAFPSQMIQWIGEQIQKAK